jgi:outer membrane protein OmpA-like peptidoglycan-associated protein
MRKIIVILLLSILATNAQNKNKKFEIKNIGINDRNQNFGAAFYGNSKIVFSSSKAGILDLYVSEIVNHNVTKSQVFSKGINANTHHSNVAFTNDLRTVYFTRSEHGTHNTVKYRKDKRPIIALYKADLSSTGQWSNITEMPFNSKKYDVGHPTLSVDNKKLIFSSNMPGGYGKTDLYEVDILGDGTYSEPRNLGSGINTKGNELHPFISGNNFLYFSSNGYSNSFGGLDIYVAHIIGDKLGETRHVDRPINSKDDDFSFIIDYQKLIGFFSSNRRGGKGSDDIYYFKLVDAVETITKKEKVRKCNQPVIGNVYLEATNRKLSDAIVYIKDKNKENIDTFDTKNGSKFNFDIKCNETYYFEAEKEGYRSIFRRLNTNNTNQYGNKIDLYLEKIKEKSIPLPKIRVGEIGFDYNESILLKRYLFQLDKAVIKLIEDPQLKIEIESHTDCRAEDEFNMKLSEDRIFALYEYLSRKGISAQRVRGRAFGETVPINHCVNDIECTEQEFLINRRTTFKLIK